MQPERWQQIDSLFQATLDRAPADRAAFLDAACAGDAELRGEVEAMLAADERAGSFIQAPAMEVAAQLIATERRAIKPDQFIGAYQIITQLGAGGMGEVFLAQDTRLGRKVALKLFDSMGDSQSRARFLREAQLASALDHPNICAIYEIGEAAGRHFIAMQYVEGKTLDQLIAGQPLELDSLLSISLQVAAALATAHSQGIIHRDIKPSNIIVTPRGQAKVLDFGLAKLLGEEPGQKNDLTGSGVVMGTPAYMSPEQACGGPLDQRSDIFSFGVALYQMATGRAPFKGKTPSETIKAVISQPHTPVAELNQEAPPELAAMIDRALAKDAAGRYPSMQELIDDLRQVAAQSGSLRRLLNSGESLDGMLTPYLPARRRELFGVPKKIAAFSALTLVAALTILALWQNKLGSQVIRTAPFHSMKISRVTTVGNVSDAAISPDGKILVYAVSDKGRRSLWVKQVAADADSSIQIMPPSESDYRGITFSRDSNYVYYLARGENDPSGALYQAPVLGGAPKRLLVNIASPITFSPDSKRFAFVRHDDARGKDALMIANAAGDGEQEVTTSRGNDWFSTNGPAWSPDGKIIAFGVGSPEGGLKMTVRGVAPEDGTLEPLSAQSWGRVGRIGWLADSGGLVVMAEEGETGNSYQLWQVSYPSGAARRITNDLSGYGAFSLSLTADSGALVTVKRETDSQIWIAPNGEASRARQITSGASNHNGGGGLGWTRDGRIVYQSLASGNDDIWIMNQDGTAPRRLTDDAGLHWGPSVSPDGRYIFFALRSKVALGIRRMALDGSGLKQLTSNEDLRPRCSPDGRWVVYWSYTSGKETIWKVPIDGGAPVQLIDKTASFPEISPDGRLIAFRYFDDQLTEPKWRVALMPFEGGRPIKLFDFPSRKIQWASDGRALTYIDNQSGVDNIWRQPIDGSAPKQLTQFKDGQIVGHAWSPDGKQLACVRGTVSSDAILIGNFNMSSTSKQE